MVAVFGDRWVVQEGQAREGGLSTVMPGVDLHSDGRRVAIKLIQLRDDDPTCRIFFEREVEALARLDHPNVVRLLGSGFDEQTSQFFVVLEWADRSLTDVLPKPDELGWDDFADGYALPLLRGLGHAHELGVVHRDIKPGNILVGNDDRPKLADFGISKIKTKVVASEGTVKHYMSRPFAPPDEASLSSYTRDVFGIAVTFLQCLTSSPLQDYPDIKRALNEVDAPAEVLALLTSASSLDADDRPRNGQMLLVELERIQAGRNRKWERPQSAHLSMTGSASRVLADGLNAGAEAVEARLAKDFAGGTHLRRYRVTLDDGRTSYDPETFVLLGETLELTLKYDDDRAHAFRVVAARERTYEQIESQRRHAWSVPRTIVWTTKPALIATPARQAIQMLVAGVEAHYDKLDEEQRRRDENRLFDGWSSLLEAKEDLERRQERPLRYRDVVIDGRRATFSLADDCDEDLVDQERVVRGLGGDLRTAAKGAVVEQVGDSVTLHLLGRPRQFPPQGELVLDRKMARVSIDRQRRAVNDVMFGSAVRADLRSLLIDPREIATPQPAAALPWRREDLDDDKKNAVMSAINAPDFFLVEGPPGTGKTAFITEFTQQFLLANPDSRVLLVSQTHVALDHALARLQHAGVDGLVRLARDGDTRVGQQVHGLRLGSQLAGWTAEVRQRADAYLSERALAVGANADYLRAAVVLEELAGVLHRIQAVTKQLEALGAEIVATRAAEESEQEAELLEDYADGIARRDDWKETAGELHGKAQQLLGDALALPTEMSAETALEAVQAVLGKDEAAHRLLGLVRLQAEWLRSIDTTSDLDAAFLRTRRVLAGTCLGFIAHPSVRDIEFDVCILDEASKATATESLVPFVRSRQWVLVGDPNQLPPMQEEALADPDLVERHSLDPQLLSTTLFDRLLTHAPEGSRSRLTKQRRMVPAIGNLISECFYNGELDSSLAEPTLSGLNTVVPAPVVWLDTSSLEGRHELTGDTNSKSPLNRCEATAAIKLISQLGQAATSGAIQRKDGEPVEVLVLSAYRRQVEDLRRRLRRVALGPISCEALTVDAVQGREADIVIFSVTRSNPHGILGFLGAAYRRRINVALSRARNGLVIVGDAHFCAAKPGPLADALAYIRRNPETTAIKELTGV